MGARPVFDAEMGRYFVGLRESRGFESQRQAAAVARQKSLSAITYQTIQRLEAGKTKTLDPTVIQQLAQLYRTPYPELIARWVERRYGVKRDLIWQAPDQDSGASESGGSPDEQRREFRALRQQFEDYKAAVQALHEAAEDIVAFDLETAGRPQGRTSTPPKSRGRGRARKAG